MIKFVIVLTNLFEAFQTRYLLYTKIFKLKINFKTFLSLLFIGLHTLAILTVITKMQLRKIGNYTVIELLGKGSFGKVYLVESEDTKHYALKSIEDTKEIIELAQQ